MVGEVLEVVGGWFVQGHRRALSRGHPRPQARAVKGAARRVTTIEAEGGRPLREDAISHTDTGQVKFEPCFLLVWVPRLEKLSCPVPGVTP